MDRTHQEIIVGQFGKFVSLTNEMKNFLEEKFVLKKYAPREMIVEGGGPARYFYLVVSGVQMIYFISAAGEKVVLGFSFSGNISGAYDAFVTQTPSKLFLESLTSSEMLAVNHVDYSELFERFPEFNIWRAQTMESLLFGRLSREVEIMTLSAKDRYDAFVSRCPAELLGIPQKYLASYLNMTPETFSRLRAQRD